MLSAMELEDIRLIDLVNAGPNFMSDTKANKRLKTDSITLQVISELVVLKHSLPRLMRPNRTIAFRSRKIK